MGGFGKAKGDYPGGKHNRLSSLVSRGFLVLTFDLGLFRSVSRVSRARCFSYERARTEEYQFRQSGRVSGNESPSTRLNGNEGRRTAAVPFSQLEGAGSTVERHHRFTSVHRAMFRRYLQSEIRRSGYLDSPIIDRKVYGGLTGALGAILWFRQPIAIKEPGTRNFARGNRYSRSSYAR